MRPEKVSVVPVMAREIELELSDVEGKLVFSVSDLS